MQMFCGATETTAVTTGWLLAAPPTLFEGLFEFDPAKLISRSPVDAHGRLAETPESLAVPVAAKAPWRRSLKECLAAARGEGGPGGDLWARLTSEVLGVVGSLDPGAPLKYEHLEKLALCDGVIKECVAGHAAHLWLVRTCFAAVPGHCGSSIRLAPMAALRRQTSMQGAGASSPRAPWS